MTHLLQLFDTADSLAESVASFLLEGYSAGDNLLVIAKPRHRDAVFFQLARKGCFSSESSQRLVALDAGDVLRQVTNAGRIDATLFTQVVTPIVRSLVGERQLRIYGEVVELCAEGDDLGAALALETQWNDLAREVPFTLMCGYSSAHFAADRAKRALRDLCRSHTHSTAHAEDTLGAYLLATG